MKRYLLWAWSKLATLVLIALVIYMSIACYGLVGVTPDPRDAYSATEAFNAALMFFCFGFIGFAAGRE